jgi:hypothetical protein
MNDGQHERFEELLDEALGEISGATTCARSNYGQLWPGWYGRGRRQSRSAIPCDPPGKWRRRFGSKVNIPIGI